ncbi:MAG TPA: 50S ribosomal protein L6, partial [Myxococcales bacterium]|nr:50S ribosomal protein L6 [Myxococcales bacterium]
MSRIGKLPISIPKGVELTIGSDSATVTVKGPKGQLSRTLPKVSIAVEDGVATVSATGSTREHSACHGLSRALLNNMITGCSKGHQRKLLIVGTGYKAETSGQKLTLTLGFSHVVVYQLPKEVKAEIADRNTTINLECADKEVLGLVASHIRAFRPPEPYKGKGIRYQGEHIRRK